MWHCFAHDVAHSFLCSHASAPRNHARHSLQTRDGRALRHFSRMKTRRWTQTSSSATPRDEARPYHRRRVLLRMRNREGKGREDGWGTVCTRTQDGRRTAAERTAAERTDGRREDGRGEDNCREGGSREGGCRANVGDRKVRGGTGSGGETCSREGGKAGLSVEEWRKQEEEWLENILRTSQPLAQTSPTATRGAP